MFHVTPKRNLSKILARGLQPQLGPRARLCGESYEAIFCFKTQSDCDTALSTWMADCFEDEPEGSLAILEVTLPKGARTHPDAIYEVAVLDPIPLQNIIQIFNEDWSQLIPEESTIPQPTRAPKRKL